MCDLVEGSGFLAEGSAHAKSLRHDRTEASRTYKWCCWGRVGEEHGGGGEGSSMGFLCSELGFPQECWRAVKRFMQGGGKTCTLGRRVVEVKGLWTTAGIGLSSGGQG